MVVLYIIGIYAIGYGLVAYINSNQDAQAAIDKTYRRYARKLLNRP